MFFYIHVRNDTMFIESCDICQLYSCLFFPHENKYTKNMRAQIVDRTNGEMSNFVYIVDILFNKT